MEDTSPSIQPIEVQDTDFDAILDIRPHASSTPTLPGAVAVSADLLAANPSGFISTKSDSLLIICDIGVRSATTTNGLRSAGYISAVSLDGGIEAWIAAGLATEAPEGLSPEDYIRYDRQLKLPGFGVTGQQALRDARVAIVGVGGLGAPVLAYLAGAGVGHMTIIDSDRVEASNLHRQPIYAMDDVGRTKSEAAAEYAAALNPVVEIATRTARIDETNAVELLEDHDVVVTCTDSFDTAHAINAAAVELGIPMVFASVYRTEGQLAVFDAQAGSCYACVFPEDSGGTGLDCSIVGVLGPVTGAIGSMQATEVVSLITGLGRPSVSKLTLYDALAQTMDSVAIHKKPNCPVCGAGDE